MFCRPRGRQFYSAMPCSCSPPSERNSAIVNKGKERRTWYLPYKKGHVMRFIVAVIVAVMTAMSSSTWAYEESSVTDGGQLVGTVALDGQVPRPKGYNLITLPDQIYCGRISDGRGWRLLQPFNVGAAGQFRDVVVYLENVEKGKSFLREQTPRIEAKDCRFVPFTTVMREKSDVVVVNLDPVMHDIQA